MLIIPSILIVHGVCGTQIASVAHETHHAGRDIYSQNPIDRARLFRKENAKMLHLRFLDHEAWEPRSLALIAALREAVDIPFGLSVLDDIPSESECRALFDAGIHRIFFPENVKEPLLFSAAQCFSSRKIVPMVDLDLPFETLLPKYHAAGIERIGIEISRGDMLEAGSIDWERFKAIAALALRHGIRITVLHGVRGYPDLKKLQTLSTAVDSLVLCRALNENRFPCQLIWREVEAETAFESAPTNNLWTNPLAGVPHI
ncbi:MAG TPA: HisA/HisF-related TIM barrel protein [Candidatus Kapabacteria bacterium]|jgi:phosphoribosylformimino-5-aminoimidazole carboxamide ribotide isomerase